MIEYTSSCTNEKLNSIFQSTNLWLNWNTSVNSNNTIFIGIMSQILKCLSHLNCKLSCWSQDDRLKLASAKHLLFSKAFDNRESKPKGFTRACQVSCDDIFLVVDRAEAMLLDWEKRFDTLFFELLNGIGGDLRILAEETILWL